MRTRLISLGCWLAGILIVAGIYLAAALLERWWIVLIAMVLAALDARRIRIWRYRSDIARSPGTLFILMLLLGWIILPWYVGLRLKILAGTAELKESYPWRDPQALVPSYPVSPSGLVQPWKNQE